MERFRSFFRRNVAALANQQLAQTPAHEAVIGMEMGEAVLGIEGGELVEKPRCLGAGACESGVDRAEEGREGASLVKLQQPASCPAASGAHGKQMEEQLVLLSRPVDREQPLQSGDVKVLVFHAILLMSYLGR